MFDPSTERCGRVLPRRVASRFPGTGIDVAIAKISDKLRQLGKSVDCLGCIGSRDLTTGICELWVTADHDSIKCFGIWLAFDGFELIEIPHNDSGTDPDFFTTLLSTFTSFVPRIGYQQPKEVAKQLWSLLKQKGF